jgi:hypothetical protein
MTALQSAFSSQPQAVGDSAATSGVSLHEVFYLPDLDFVWNAFHACNDVADQPLLRIGRQIAKLPSVMPAKLVAPTTTGNSKRQEPGKQAP